MWINPVRKSRWLIASLLFGISFPLAQFIAPPLVVAIIWKMLAVGMLVPFALGHEGQDFELLAGVLALCMLGDGLVEIELAWGAVAFGLAHSLAILLYWRNWRSQGTASQRFMGIAILLLVPAISWMLTKDAMAAGYAILLAAMAAMAWNSRFSRYRVGLGAVMFVISDLMIFARESEILDGAIVSLPIWYLYFAGMFLIAIGVSGRPQKAKRAESLSDLVYRSEASTRNDG